MDKIVRRDGYIRFPFVGGSAIIKCEDIIYIETSRHKNIFHLAGEQYSIYRKLDEIEQDLAGLGFVRIHQSYLVNMRYIERISSYVMYLSTGQELSVPKSRYPQVKKIYGEWIEDN